MPKLRDPQYVCPHCGQACISFWRKQALGPATSTECRSCGKRVSVGPGAIASMLPLIAALIAARYLEAPGPVALVLVVLGIVCAGFLSHRFVPLVAR